MPPPDGVDRPGPPPRRRDPPPVGPGLAPDTQPGHPAVRVDVEADVRSAGVTPDREVVFGVPREWRAKQELRPGAAEGAQSARGGRAGEVRRIERALRWMVAAEMIGVHGEGANHARDTEPDDAPVVSRPTAAAGFPTVHPLAALRVPAFNEHAAPRLEQVALGGEELVAREERAAAQASGREIDKPLSQRTHLPPPPAGKAP